MSTVAFGRVAAIVSDVPTDRPLGVRGDLVAHEMVLDAVAARDAVVPMRFPRWSRSAPSTSFWRRTKNIS